MRKQKPKPAVFDFDYHKKLGQALNTDVQRYIKLLFILQDRYGRARGRRLINDVLRLERAFDLLRCHLAVPLAVDYPDRFDPAVYYPGANEVPDFVTGQDTSPDFFTGKRKVN